MTADLWTRVDAYIGERLVPEDDALRSALAASAASAAAGLPAIAVSAAQGKMLNLLVLVTHAERILEIGTLGAYSTIWLARGLKSGGRLTTLEVDARHAKVALENLARAGLRDLVDIRVGKALESLPILERERAGPFDLVFIDADKQNNPLYIEWAIRLGRPGTLVVVDNVVRGGSVLDAASTDAAIIGTRRAYEVAGSHPRLAATVIQTVGTKGYDGFMIAVVTSPAERPVAISTG